MKLVSQRSLTGDKCVFELDGCLVEVSKKN